MTIPNRAWVSPMCQYSATEGVPNRWHQVHLGQFALGGAGLVMAEASAVEPRGRISPADAGLWSDEQADAWRVITDFLRSQGAVSGVQLAHAGRKASDSVPWEGRGSVPPEEGGWKPLGPTGEPFGNFTAPEPVSTSRLAEMTEMFVAGARNAMRAGFDVIELHFAHGYFAHEMYSPLVNTRDDEYGGDFDGRVRWLLETAEAVRAAWPDDRPLFARISATDWVGGGWTGDDSVALARELHARGVDVIDASTGGAVPRASIPVEPGYQVPFAERVRSEAGVPTAAVGLITEARQAEKILQAGSADAIFLAREMLRNPRWPQHAARELEADLAWPAQYERAR